MIDVAALNSCELETKEEPKVERNPIPSLFSKQKENDFYYDQLLERVNTNCISTNSNYHESNLLFDKYTLSFDTYNNFIASTVEPNIVNVYSKKFIGHMTGPIPPLVSHLNDLSINYNQNLVKIETSGIGSKIEREVLAFFHKEIFHYQEKVYTDGINDPEKVFGVVTNGGTMSNITAMSYALSNLLDANDKNGVNNQGIHYALTAKGYEKAVIIAPKLCHYSFNKAAKIIGIGKHNVDFFEWENLTDSEIQKRINDKINDYKAKNVLIVALVGVAGTTESGEINNLELIADIAEQNNIHFHADAAFGGAFLLSEQSKQKFKGIERADSVTICGHKQLYMPIGSSFVIFKDLCLAKASENNTHYQARKGSFDIGRYTIEGTRNFSALTLHGTLAIMGKKGFEEVLDDNIARCVSFHNIIASHEEFQIYKFPTLNILLYRYIPEKYRGKVLAQNLTLHEEEEINSINETLQKEQFARGNSFVSYTKLKCSKNEFYRTWFRTVLMNPFTTIEDLKDILEEQLRIVAEIKLK